MSGRGRAAAWLVSICLQTAGCGGGSPERAEDVSGADSLPAAERAGAPSPGDSAGATDTVAPEPPGPTLLGEGAPREYRLLLVNRLAGAARVFASAGAGRVALDTVPARDSIFVDVRVRADRIFLEAEDGSGRRVSADSVDLAPATPNRWEIPSSSRDRSTARGAGEGRARTG